METKTQQDDDNERRKKFKHSTSKINIEDSDGEEENQEKEKEKEKEKDKEFEPTQEQFDLNNNNKKSSDSQTGKENYSTTQTNQQQQQQKNEIKQQEGVFCFECNKPLARSRHLINIVGQTNKTWHPECFRCNVCNSQLDREVSCHIYKDKILCKQDYLKLQRDKSIKCSRCKWSISSLDWVRKAGDYVYHLACFSCDICMRQLSTGEQFTLKLVQDEKNTVRLLCRLHFAIENPQSNSNPPNNSTKASSSSSPSSSSSNLLYTLNQNQNKQTSPSVCSSEKTNEILSSNGQVPSSANRFDINQTYQAKHQHHTNSNNQMKNVHSFCNYENGQYFNMLHSTTNKSVSSANNGQFLMIDSATTSNCKDSKIHEIDTYERNKHQIHSASNFNNPLSIVDELRQHLLSTGDRDMIDGSCSGNGTNGGGGCGSGASTSSSTNDSASGHLIGMSQSKSKRVRTTFTEDQLSILQTHFQIDSNPDGQDLERIATITGLSKRVTQVWFQNSRARQKKYMIKRKPSNNSSTSPVALVCHSNTTNVNDNNHNISSLVVAGNENSIVSTTLDENLNQHRIINQSDFKNNPRQQTQLSRPNWSNETNMRSVSSFRGIGMIDTSSKDENDEDHSSIGISSIDDNDEEDQLLLSDNEN